MAIVNCFRRVHAVFGGPTPLKEPNLELSLYLNYKNFNDSFGNLRENVGNLFVMLTQFCRFRRVHAVLAVSTPLKESNLLLS